MKNLHLLPAIIFLGFIFVQSCGSSSEEYNQQRILDSIRVADSIAKSQNTPPEPNNTNAEANQNSKTNESSAKSNKQESMAKVISPEKAKQDSAKSVKTYSEKSFYGTWFTIVDEPVDGKCTIEVEWKANNTTDVVFKYANGKEYRTHTKWKYKAPNYDEVYEDGSTGKAIITWVNKDKFQLKIIENQDTKDYKNIVRIYERKK